MSNVAELFRNFENRFDAPGYKEAIEWLACFMEPGKEELELFGDGVDFIASKYDLAVSTVAFDVTVYVADGITITMEVTE